MHGALLGFGQSASRSAPSFTDDDTTTSLTTSYVTSDELLTLEVVIVTSCLSALLVLSLVSNGTICCVFYSKPQLLTVSNYFVLNLACCQLGLCLLVLPFYLATVVRGQWRLSEAWCRGQSFFLVVLLVALHYSLVAISLDRTFAIVSSLRYPYVFTHTLGSMVVAGTWILGLVAGLPPLVGWGSFTFNQQQYLCSVDWQADTAYTFIFLSFVFFLPLLVQCWCYASIFRAALGHSKRSAKVFPSSSTNTTSTSTTATTFSRDSPSCENPVPVPVVRSSSSRECKALKIVVLIAAAYLVCWALFVVVAVLQWHGQPLVHSVQLAASALLFLSGLTNPLIYGFMNRLTRFEILKLWRRLFQRLSGRLPTNFSTDNDDGLSSTWTTTVPTSRQPSSLWVVPSQRVRRASKSMAVTVHNMEMLTIREESELEEDPREVGQMGRAALGEDCRLSVVPGLGNVPRQDQGGDYAEGEEWTNQAGDATLYSTDTGKEPATRHGPWRRAPGLKSSGRAWGMQGGGGSSQPQLILNPSTLHSHSLLPGRRRSSSLHVPHQEQYHSHPHNHLQFKPQKGDLWDLFCVDPGLQQVKNLRLSSSSASSRSRHESSMERINTEADCASPPGAASTPTRRSSRQRWRFVQAVQRFLHIRQHRRVQGSHLGGRCDIPQAFSATVDGRP